MKFLGLFFLLAMLVLVSPWDHSVTVFLVMFAILARYGFILFKGTYYEFLSPLLLVSSIAFIFYVFVPFFAVSFIFPLDPRPFGWGFVDGSFKPVMKEVFGSEAQRFVILFSVVGLAAHSLVYRNAAVMPSAADGLFPQRCVRLVLIAGIACSGVALILYLVSDPVALRGTLFMQMFVPLQSVILLTLLYCYSTSGTPHIVLVGGTWAFALAVMLTFGMGKMPFLLMFAGLALFVALKRPALPIVLTALGVCVASLILVILIADGVRSSPDPVTRDENAVATEPVAQLMSRKLITRQLETMYCFKGVVDLHRHDRETRQSLFFWIPILVPRQIWPDKPNFSLGGEYATTYCRLPDIDIGGHSASITLLGQPLIHGGVLGLMANGLVLLVVLGGVSVAIRYRQSMTLVLAACFIPWLVDFDQDFSLYIGNLIKFGLVIVLSFAVLSVCARVSKIRGL